MWGVREGGDNKYLELIFDFFNLNIWKKKIFLKIES